MVLHRFDRDFNTELRELFRLRRDVRSFRSDPVPEGILETLLDAARFAPSVGLSQPTRLVSVESPEARQAVIDTFMCENDLAKAEYEGERKTLYGQLKLAGLREAPVHWAVFTDEETDTGAGLGRRTMPETLHYSTVAAITLMWLAARAHGVGVGWVSILDPEVVKATLNVPGSWALTAYLCIGYPQEESEVPELERRGWEHRDKSLQNLLRR